MVMMILICLKFKLVFTGNVLQLEKQKRQN